MYKQKNLGLDLQNLHKNLGLGAPVFKPCAGSKGMETGRSQEFSVWPVLASWWALGSVGYLSQKEKVGMIKTLSIAFWVSLTNKHTFICACHMHITNIKKGWEKGRNRTLGSSSFPLKHAETFPGPQLHSRAFPLQNNRPSSTQLRLPPGGFDSLSSMGMPCPSPLQCARYWVVVAACQQLMAFDIGYCALRLTSSH